MLRITSQSDASAVSHYFADGHDYLAEGQEAAGVWGGKGADRLGLSGAVTPEDFRSLVHNRYPGTDTRLTGRDHPNRRVGWDFTFSVGKSVSLALEVTQDQRILDAFKRAVADTMADVERDALCQVRANGEVDTRRTGNLVHATFVHRSARPVGGLPDPQLHAHCFVMNATRDGAEGKWKAVELGDVKAQGWYYEAAFQARLAKSLVDMGYGVRRKGKFFELEGVSDALVEKFSRRTQRIEAEAERRGVMNPEFKAELGGKTREFKGTETYDTLRRYWLSRLTAGERDALEHLPSQTAPLPSPEQSARYAIDHVFERDAVVPTRRVLEHGLRHGYGRVTVDDLRVELDRAGLLTKGELSTTREMLALERRLVDWARDGQGGVRPARAAGINGVRRQLATLNPGQSSAAKHAWRSKDRVTLIRGAAGTGKTTALEVIAAGYRDAGLPVQAVAVSSGAAEELRGVDAGAATVARFLIDEKMQRRVAGGVVVLDEASLIGTRQAAELVGVLDKLDARLLAVGDIRQHNAVAAGSPFKAWQDYASLPVAEMTEVMRQRGSYKQVAEALSEHRVAEALDRLDGMGWVKELPDGERLDAIAGEYLDALRAKRSVLVVAPTRAECDEVTERIRGRLKEEGRIKDDERTFTRLVAANLTEAERGEAGVGGLGVLVRGRGRFEAGRAYPVSELVDGGINPGSWAAYRRDEIRLATGDAVRITRNGKAGGRRLLNGSQYTVAGFDKNGGIRLSNGWVLPADYGFIDHGLVTTSHASQGKTVDVALVSAPTASFGAVGRQQAYVSGTRAKHKLTVFTDDVEALKRAVDRDQGKGNATDLVEMKAVRRPSKLRAHAAFMQKVRQLADKAVESVRQLNRRKEKDNAHELGR